MSLGHFGFGQQRIADKLALEGVSVCPSNVRNVRFKEGIENKYKRILRPEDKTLTKGLKLTEAQIKRLEKATPEFAEWHVKSENPGYLLCQDTFYVGRLKCVGQVYLQAVVDTYGRVALGKRFMSKRQEAAADVL